MPLALSKRRGAPLSAGPWPFNQCSGAFVSVGVSVMSDYWLSAITFVPIVGALIIAGLGGSAHRYVRRMALAFSLLGLALTMVVCCRFDPNASDLQFVERHEWVPSI